MRNEALDRLAQDLAARLLPHLTQNLVVTGNPNGHGNKVLPRLMNIKETAVYTGISESGLYHLVARREIPFVKIGRALKFSRWEIDRWIRANSSTS
jgi:excisionase family DNA binding protein